MAEPVRGEPVGDRATVYIGPKPVMSYVFQVVAELNSGAGPVVVKARGNAIAKAVDVAEVVRRRLLTGQVEIGPVTIDTERLVNRDGREANVSSISIRLTRTGELPARPPPAAPPAPAGRSAPTSPRAGPPTAGSPS